MLRSTAGQTENREWGMSPSALAAIRSRLFDGFMPDTLLDLEILNMLLVCGYIRACWLTLFWGRLLHHSKTTRGN
jgi:hypothetical protein